MAALFFHTEVRTLSEATANIGELKLVIENDMRQHGFTDVVRTESEVAGNRSGVRLSVTHLHIDGPRFWEVVMAAGDTVDATRNTINEEVNNLHQFHFL